MRNRQTNHLENIRIFLYKGIKLQETAFSKLYHGLIMCIALVITSRVILQVTVVNNQGPNRLVGRKVFDSNYCRKPTLNCTIVWKP